MKRIAAFVLAFVILFSAFPALSGSAADTPAPSVAGHNLSLQSNIWIKYYVRAEGTDAPSLLIFKNARDRYTHADSPDAVLTDYALETISGAAYYSYVYKGLSASEITTDVYAVPFTASGAYGETDKYSILRYALNKLGVTGTKTSDEKLVSLLESLVSYGRSAQEFAGQTDRLADKSWALLSLENGSFSDGTQESIYPFGSEVTVKLDLAELSYSKDCSRVYLKDSYGAVAAEAAVLDGKAIFTFAAPAENEVYHAEPAYTLLLYGDQVAASHCMADILAQFAAADGIDLHFIPVTSTHNVSRGGTLNAYSYLKNQTPQNTISNAFTDETPVDYFLGVTGRDMTLLFSSSFEKEKSIFADIKNKLLAQNPRAKMILIAPYGYADGSPVYESDYNGGTTTSTNTGRPNPDTSSSSKYLTWLGYAKVKSKKLADHTRLILQNAHSIRSLLGSAASVCPLGDAFVHYYKNCYSTVGINLFDDISNPAEAGRNPSAAGSYYTACVLYAQIFGKSPVGSTCFGYLDEEDAIRFQNIAHDFVLGASVEKPAAKSAMLSVREDSIPYDWSKWGIEKTETYPENYDILYSTAMAYRQHGNFIEYDQYGLSPRFLNYTSYRREEKATAETASPQHTVHLDCSGFVYSVYKDAFNYGFKNKSGEETNQTADMIALQGMKEDVFYWEPAKAGALSAEQAKLQFIRTLQPGDVIVYRMSTWGHTMLYLGNGWFIHCTSGNRFSGGSSDYNFFWQFDVQDIPGSIFFQSIDNLLYPTQSRYLFSDSLKSLLIVRPSLTSGGLTPTDNAKNRLQNLDNIAVCRTTSAPAGITVNPGDTVTYTVTATNYNKQEKTVAFTEALPSGLSYLSGSGNFTMTLRPFETKTYSYTLKVGTGTASGTTLRTDAHAGGVILPALPVYVAKTLTETQQSGVRDLVLSLSADSELELAKQVAAAYGSTITASSKKALVGTYFDTVSATHRRRSYQNTYMTLNGSYINDANEGYRAKNTAAWAGTTILAPNLYGGAAFGYQTAAQTAERIRYIAAENFLPGDILVTVDQTAEQSSSNTPKVTTAPQHTEDDVRIFICIGKNEFVTLDRGDIVTYSGSSDMLSLLQWVHGEDLFFVLRPSIGK